MSNRKDAFYFPHDSNAHMDERILELRAEFGWEGYGVYWALVEKMRDTADFRLRRRSIAAMSVALGIPKDYLLKLTAFSIEVGLFEGDEEHYWSPALNRRMMEVETRRKRRQQAGSKGGTATAQKRADDIPPPTDSDMLPPTSSIATQDDSIATQTPSNAEHSGSNATTEEQQGKERKGEERKDQRDSGDVREPSDDDGEPEKTEPPEEGVTRPPPTNPFDPQERWPSADDVRAAFGSSNVPADEAVGIAEHFESRGWVDRYGIPIRNWKLAINSAYEFNRKTGKQSGTANQRSHPGKPQQSTRGPLTGDDLTRDLERSEAIARAAIEGGGD